MGLRKCLFALVALAILAVATAAPAQVPSPRDESQTAVTPYLSFVGIVPCRLVDTREGGFPAGYGPPMLAATSYRTFVIPEARCGIPSSAKAVSMNVTVVNATGNGYVAVWPGTQADQPNPLVSSLNYVAGDIVPNAVVVPLGGGGQITTLTQAAVHLLIDVNGYFTDTPAAQIANVPNGTIAATTVQAAINELATEKAAASGYPAGKIVVTSTVTGTLTTDTQLAWDDVNDVLTLTTGSFKATGTKGRSIMAASPGLARTSSSGVTLTPGIYGELTITASTTGQKNIYIPLPIPSQLFGTAARVVSVKVCYKTSNSTSYITATYVRTVSDSIVGTDLFTDGTNRASTTAQCYTVSDVSPVNPAGALNLYLPMTFSTAGHYITIGSIEVTLDQI